MDSMVERVANAITAEQAKNRSAFPSNLDLARAAIKAMREPTQEMSDAGVAAFTNVRDIWNAMLDAALAHTQEG